MTQIPSGDYYYIGEKPPPRPCQFETEEGVPIASIAGATLSALCSLDGGAEFTVTCTNAGDGTFTVNWATSVSSFTGAGTLRIAIRVIQGSYDWIMGRFSIPIIAR